MAVKKDSILLKGSSVSVQSLGTAVQMGGSKITLENTLKSDAMVFDTMNKYRNILDYSISIFGGEVGKAKTNTSNKDNANGQDGTDTKDAPRIIYNQIGSPSLFNPYYAVLSGGIAPNVPLLDTHVDGQPLETNSSGETGNKVTGHVNIYPTDDCSIKNLVALSKLNHGPLGQARYKYSDFMYCKDLGKISNNHMITLRKFSTPVPDYIFYATTYDDAANFSIAGDVGRLITWFGTDDNKLEDILKYSYKATWKELESKIDEKPSQETDPARGVAGDLVNLFSAERHDSVNKGVSPSSLAFILATSSSDTHLTEAPYANNPAVNGTPYWDKNKIYDPKDTIRNTYIYEGKLEFEHAFTLVFKYKLRGYDNINAKSAFLDLLGNILSVTYRTGRFWAGEQRIIGAPQNKSGWKKAQDFINNGIDAGGTFISQLLKGDSASDAFGNLGQAISSGLNSCFGLDISSILSDPKAAVKDLLTTLKDSGIGGDLKGIVKNALGRPAIYAFDSLLTNDKVGLWHVTIGNPLNPIASIGNLILENAEITHSGPLGLDDFPTELTVTVSLKHGMPRDSVDIQRMYTQGRGAIYSKIGNENNFNFAGNNAIVEQENQKSKGTPKEDDAKTKGKNQQTQSLSGVINSRPDFSETPNEFAGWVGDMNVTRITKANMHELK